MSRTSAGRRVASAAPDAALRAAIESIVAACGEGVRSLLSGHPRLPPPVVQKLARTAPERQRFELGEVRAGRRPFATKTTVFDTTGYGEVVSRLARAGGAANKAAAVLGAAGPTSADRAQATALRRASGTLWTLVRRGAGRAARGGADGSAGRSPVGRRDWSGVPATPVLVRACRGDLARALAFVEKCVRDLRRLPGLPADRRFDPTAGQAHDCLARILALAADAARLGAATKAARRVIVSHANPDADALVAAWLAERFLFPGERTRVLFVGYTHNWARGPAADCVLDLGGVHAPEVLAFDHKPPAFADRNDTCTARLLWDHLREIGRPVAGLERLVEVVREADRMPRRRAKSADVRASEAGGLLARVRAVGAAGVGDGERYRRVRRWLDRAYPDAAS